MRTNELAHQLVSVVTVLVLSLTFLRLACGQSTATLLGRVVDPSGAVVPSAQVTLRNRSTGIERTTASDAAGNYQLAAMAPGPYEAKVQASGFQTQIVEGFNIEVGRTLVE